MRLLFFILYPVRDRRPDPTIPRVRAAILNQESGGNRSEAEITPQLG
ncbi:hypothetical protein J0895_02270 [Phormidium pseudopriestleyi FRX01]|uniref:Uncharacterized protein n=1 Tax=Phormidium pseudopriestleyi FRX01 TaxID=1759528 RepID=A0ABS3FLG1_9CYAN|nr:hypothetical protein [Phormidium pseudopriestleyi]MBO0347946.1 hypothetical protein [Phormidium pseudopriestleyi FRX01]